KGYIIFLKKLTNRRFYKHVLNARYMVVLHIVNPSTVEASKYKGTWKVCGAQPLKILDVSISSPPLEQATPPRKKQTSTCNQQRKSCVFVVNLVGIGTNQSGVALIAIHPCRRPL
ncbi:hypothetical protein GOP47_0020256, partial [Adiantum capillus-veneris]